MITHQKDFPPQMVKGTDRLGHPYTVKFPGYTATVAPTLGIVHDWLWDYPFYYSWRDGWLCPFATDIQRKRITCSAGRRAFCSGRGLLLGPNHIGHLPATRQARLRSRVICYEWCHRLGDTYWNIPIDELYQLPDNPRLAAVLILRLVYQQSAWADWARLSKTEWRWNIRIPSLPSR